LSANIAVHFPEASCLEKECLWSGAEFDLLYEGDPLGGPDEIDALADADTAAEEIPA
jgi:hypothetical protein